MLDVIKQVCIIRNSFGSGYSGRAGSLKKLIRTIDKLARQVKMVGFFGLSGFALRDYGKTNCRHGVDKLNRLCIIGRLIEAPASTLFNNSIKIICVGACDDCK